MKIIFASHNENKAKEIQSQIPKNITIITLKDLNDTAEIEETGKTLEENALIKATAIANKYQLPCFADDSGLEIEALNNAPGVFSARYAGEEKDDNKNMDLVLKNLENKSNKNAAFRTVIALIINEKTMLFEGKIEGEIIDEKRGTNGFGYDPIFIPKNQQKTFAEMSLTEKNKQSHRAKAVKKLVDYLTEINQK